MNITKTVKPSFARNLQRNLWNKNKFAVDKYIFDHMNILGISDIIREIDIECGDYISKAIVDAGLASYTVVIDTDEPIVYSKSDEDQMIEDFKDFLRASGAIIHPDADILQVMMGSNAPVESKYTPREYNDDEDEEITIIRCYDDIEEQLGILFFVDTGVCIDSIDKFIKYIEIIAEPIIGTIRNKAVNDAELENLIKYLPYILFEEPIMQTILYLTKPVQDILMSYLPSWSSYYEKNVYEKSFLNPKYMVFDDFALDMIAFMDKGAASDYEVIALLIAVYFINYSRELIR